jgi:hypothetical protein
MNLGTMKTSVQRIAGVDSTDPLLDWINAAMHEFEDAYGWPFLETTGGVTMAANSNAPNLPTDLALLRTAKVDTTPTGGSVARRSLIFVPRVKFEDQSWYDPTSTGEPTHYTLVGNSTILLWPTPDQNYHMRVYYQKFLPDLAIDADVPGVPAKYHFTIVRGAAATALEAENEEDRADSWRGQFEDAIERHISKLGGSRQGGTLNTVRDVMGYGS